MVSYSLPIAVVQPGGKREPKGFEQAAPKPQAADAFTKALLELPCEYTHRNPLEWDQCTDRSVEPHPRIHA